MLISRLNVARSLTLVCLGSLTPIASAQVLIDDFTSKDPNRAPAYPQSVFVDMNFLQGGPETGLAGVPGGNRLTLLGESTMDVDNVDRATINVVNTGGNSFFDYDSTAGANANFEIEYGGATTPMNLNASGNTVLRLSLLAFDAPTGQSMSIRADLNTSGGGQTTPFVFVSTPGAQTIDLDLSTIAPATLADLDTIRIQIDVPKGGDVRIDSVRLDVPEPAALLAAVPATGWIALRRRSRRTVR